VKFFGPSSHFVIHDAGGVHEEVLEVLKPWMELGYVTVQDIRDEERFDGYYHNQFMVVNDCLHRYKFMAKWMFFFDVDEYIYVPPKTTIKTVLDSLSEYDQFTIEQMPMSSKICLSQDYGKTHRYSFASHDSQYSVFILLHLTFCMQHRRRKNGKMKWVLQQVKINLTFIKVQSFNRSLHNFCLK